MRRRGRPASGDENEQREMLCSEAANWFECEAREGVRAHAHRSSVSSVAVRMKLSLNSLRLTGRHSDAKIDKNPAFAPRLTIRASCRSAKVAIYVAL